MPITLYERWLNIRDRINNRLIRFLLRHCWLDNLTLRACINTVPRAELEHLINERRVRET